MYIFLRKADHVLNAHRIPPEGGMQQVSGANIEALQAGMSATHHALLIVANLFSPALV